MCTDGDLFHHNKHNFLWRCKRMKSQIPLCCVRGEVQRREEEEEEEEEEEKR
jgi:hypothetical protein